MENIYIFAVNRNEKKYIDSFTVTGYINGKLFVTFFLHSFQCKVNLILSYPSQVVLTLP